MRKIREVLRLSWELELPDRQVAQSCAISKGAVYNYLQRAKAAGLTWPLPHDLDDQVLEQMLFTRSEDLCKRIDARGRPDWVAVQKQLERKGVTLQLLWKEFRDQHPRGLEYSTFTQQFRSWQKTQGLTMRLDPKPGEKLYVDYAGLPLLITDPSSGELHKGQVFVATLGASNYLYCEVSASQSSFDWLSSHRRALEFFGGVPKVIVPDNLKAGVKSPSHYEPELNPAYAEFAQHYGVAIIPARVRKPRDKAKVEVGVQIVERHILAPLRNRTFFTLSEANEAVWTLLEQLNAKPFQKLEGSRKSVFETFEREALDPLPPTPYVISEWKKARVGPDYHVELEGHYYSVPYRYAKEQVELRFTPTTLEVYLNGARVASHARPLAGPNSRARGRHTTVTEHMPKAHQRHSDWSPERLIAWAQKAGECTAQFVEKLLEDRPHPEQGYRSCLGVMRLSKEHGPERLEAACKRALSLKAYSYKSVKSILTKKLENESLPDTELGEAPSTLGHHRNVRGSSYFRTSTDEADESLEGFFETHPHLH